MVQEINTENFDKEVISHNGVIVVDFLLTGVVLAENLVLFWKKLNKNCLLRLSLRKSILMTT